tara:strand:+ start:4233 stop:5252 length:1020 start_codon:yes stop_codon:yes gene_type:complete
MAGTVGLNQNLISAFSRIGQEATGDTSKEILKNAGMDFKVQKQHLYDNMGQTLETGYRRLVRTDTNQTLGVVSKKYEIFQNSQVMDLFSQVCKQSGAKIDRIGMIENGAKIFMSFRNPEGLSFGHGEGQEDFDIYWYLLSSHDGSTGIKLFPSPVRLNCANQGAMLHAFLLRNGINPRKLSIRHSNLIDVRVDQLMENLGIINDLSYAFVEEASGLLNSSMGMGDRVEYYIDVLGLSQNDTMLKGGKDYDANNPFGLGTRANNTLDVLMDLENSTTNTVGEMGGTKWQAYNVVTEYLDHRWTMDKEGTLLVPNEKRVQSAVMGPGARMKAQAYEKILVA